MAERGDDISGDRADGKTERTVNVTYGGIRLTIDVVIDRDGDIDTNETEIVRAVFDEIQDDLMTEIMEKVR